MNTAKKTNIYIYVRVEAAAVKKKEEEPRQQHINYGTMSDLWAIKCQN